MLMPSLLSNSFDLFDDAWMSPWFSSRDFRDAEKRLYGHNAKNLMSTDIKENEEGYELIMDLPGFKKEDVQVELNKGYLTVTAAKGLEKDEAESEEAKKEGRYIRKERYSGQMKRSFYVGDYLTQEDIKANFRHGLLTMEIPKKTAPKEEPNRYIAIGD